MNEFAKAVCSFNSGISRSVEENSLFEDHKVAAIFTKWVIYFHHWNCTFSYLVRLTHIILISSYYSASQREDSWHDFVMNNCDAFQTKTLPRSNGSCLPPIQIEQANPVA